MRLHLASLDFPEKDNHYIPDYVESDTLTFEGDRIQIDNHQFLNCTFVRCTFLHAGGPFGFDECEIDDDTTLVSNRPGAQSSIALGNTLMNASDELSPE